jgi:hypothetical protein
VRALQAFGAALAVLVSLFIFRLTFHLYTDHETLDVFHLLVAAAAGMIGLLLIVRLMPRRG